MNNQELLKQIRELKELKAFADELQKEIESIEDSIKFEMTSQNLEELKVDVYKIKYKEVISNRFDSLTFKKVYSDLYNQFTKTVKIKRFSVV